MIRIQLQEIDAAENYRSAQETLEKNPELGIEPDPNFEEVLASLKDCYHLKAHFLVGQHELNLKSPMYKNGQHGASVSELLSIAAARISEEMTRQKQLS